MQDPVAKRTRYAEYKDRYANSRFELSPEGILLMLGGSSSRTAAA